jgi:hypothetical protein
MLIDHDIISTNDYLTNLSTLTSNHNNLLSHNAQSASLLPNDNFMNQDDPTPRPGNNLLGTSAQSDTSFNPITTFVLYARWLFYNSSAAVNSQVLLRILTETDAQNSPNNLYSPQINPFSSPNFLESSSLATSSSETLGQSILESPSSSLHQSSIEDSSLGRQTLNSINLNRQFSQQYSNNQPKLAQQSTALGRGLIFIDDGLLSRVLDAVELISDRDPTVLARIFIPRDVWIAGVQSFLHLYQATPLLPHSIDSQPNQPSQPPQLTTLPSLHNLQLPTQYDLLYQFDEQYSKAHQPFSDDVEKEAQHISTHLSSSGAALYSLPAINGSNGGRRGGSDMYKVGYSPSVAKIIFSRLSEMWVDSQQQLQISNSLQQQPHQTQQHQYDDSQNYKKGNRLLGTAPVTVGVNQQQLFDQEQVIMGNKLQELERQNNIYNVSQVPHQLNKYMLLYYLEYLLNGYSHYQLVQTDIQTFLTQSNKKNNENSIFEQNQQNNTQNTHSSANTPAIIGSNIVSLPTTAISLPLQYGMRSNLQGSHLSKNTETIPITKLDYDFRNLEFLYTTFGRYLISTLFDFFSRCGISSREHLQTYLLSPDHAHTVSPTQPSSSLKTNIHLSAPRSKHQPIVHLKRQISTLFSKFSHFLHNSTTYLDPTAIISLLFTITPSLSGLNQLIPPTSQAPTVFLANLLDKSNVSNYLEKNSMLAQTLNNNLYHSIFVLESTELYTKLNKFDVAMDICVQRLDFQRAEALCQSIPTLINNDGNNFQNKGLNKQNNQQSNQLNRMNNDSNDKTKSMARIGTIGHTGVMIGIENISTVPQIMNSYEINSRQQISHSTNIKNNTNNSQNKNDNLISELKMNNSFAVLFQLLLQYATQWAQEELLKRQAIEERERAEKEAIKAQQIALEKEKEKELQLLLEKQREQEQDLLSYNNYEDDNRSIQSDVNTVQTGLPKIQQQSRIMASKNKLQAAKIVTGSSLTTRAGPVKIVTGAGTDNVAIANQTATAADPNRLVPFQIKRTNLRGRGFVNDIHEENDHDDDNDNDNDDDLEQKSDEILQKNQNIVPFSPFLEAALRLLASNPNAIDLGAAFNSLFSTQTVIPSDLRGQYKTLVTTDSLKTYNSQYQEETQHQTASSLPISAVYPLFNHLLSSLHEQQRQQLVLKALQKKQLYSIKTVLQHHEQTFFQVDSLKSCGNCHKKIHNSAFVLIPCQFLLQYQFLREQNNQNFAQNNQNDQNTKNVSSKTPTFSINIPVSAITPLSGHMHASPKDVNNNHYPTPVSSQTPTAPSPNPNLLKSNHDVLSSFGGFNEEIDFSQGNSNINKEKIYIINAQNLKQYTSFRVFLHYICFNSMKQEQGGEVDM